MSITPVLHPYQKYAVTFAYNIKRSGLLLDMGLGKTLIILTLIRELWRTGTYTGHVLIIAPKNVALATWPDEVKKWSTTQHLPIKVLAGLTKSKRDKALAEIQANNIPTIYVINNDIVRQVLSPFKPDKSPFQMIVIDEWHKYAHHNTQSFKFLKHYTPYVERFVGMTGTPSPNNIENLWSEMFLLDNGKRLGPSITSFRNHYMVPSFIKTPQGFPCYYIPQIGADKVILKLISDCVLSMKNQDYLKLPEVTYSTLTCQMTKQEQNVYEELLYTKLLELQDGSTIEGKDPLTLSNYLLQLANGAVYTYPEDKDTKDNEKIRQVVELHQHKLDLLEELIDHLQGQPLLVFYKYKHDITRIKERFPEAVVLGEDGWDITRCQTEWNQGNIPLLLAHPMTASTGLNLQQGGRHICWFGITPSLTDYLQSNARIARQGQTDPVFIYHLVTKNTLDEKLLPRLQEKGETQKSIMTFLKKNAQEVVTLLNEIKKT